MKNFFYSLMTFAAVASALVSCSREEVEVKDNNEFVYRFEIAEGTTKATLDQEGVWWEVEKDKVGVIVDGENIQADVVESDGKKMISFSRETAIDAGTRIYSYYPYSEAVTSAESAQVTIPTDQKGASVSAMPMAGIPITLESEADAVSRKINFLNLGAIIDFRIYSTNAVYANETVESVTFKSDSDAAKASGTATIDLTVTGVQGGENPSAPDIAFDDLHSYRRATVTQSVSVAASKDAATTPMYLVVAPGTFSGTVTVNTNAASYTFEFTNKTLARNTITKFNMNIGSSKAEREAMTKTYTSIGQNNLSEGVYLLGAYDSSTSSTNIDGVGTYICWVPNIADAATTANGTVISHIKYSGVEETSISSDGLENRSADIIGSEVEVTQSGNYWLFKVRSTGEYLYFPGNSGEKIKVGFTSQSSEAGHTWSSTYRYRIIYPSDIVFYHSGSERGFTYSPNKSADNLRFYKLSGSTKSQTLSFQNVPENGFTWDLASQEDFVEPTLVGAKTTVVYTSSNTAIANVGATTGEVEFGTKTGTVTITAAAVGEDGYASAEASYKIKVINSNAQADTYYKASILDTGYEYIIVSNGQALKNNGNGNVVAASPVTVKENNTIDLYDDETEGILWEATAVTHDYGTHTLKNDAIYLYRKTSNSTTTLIGDNSTSESNYIPWRYNGDYLWNGKTTSYYANYDGGWKISTSEPEIKTVLFTARLPRTLYFENADDLTYDLSQGGDFAEPTLVNPDNFDVTFDTSNPNIATVDSEGNVSFNANNVTGKVIVYARVAPNNTYQGAEASYVITVMAPHYYTKVNSTSDIASDGKYIIVYESGKKAFNPILNSGNSAFDANANNTVNVAINGSDIVGTEDAPIGPIDENCQFSFTKDGDNYYVKSIKTNYYLKLGSSSIDAQTGTLSLVVAITGGALSISRKRSYGSSYYLYYNSYFRSGSTTPSGMALYKLVYGVPKQSQTISFVGEDETLTLGTTYQIGGYVTLHGIQQSEGHSEVSYDTSDHDVAVVELVDDTYKVKLVGAGTTDIIVTAAETNTYYSATATYQLTINKGTQTIAYSPANAEPEYDLASSNWNVALPTLDVSGVKTQVVFESSNTNVATVSDQGVVSLVAPITKGATATITATAIESDNYEEASASFTLKVVDSNAQPSVYNKVTSADDLDINAKYLVVYESGSKVFKPFLTTSGTSFSKSTNNVVGVTIASNQITSDALGECEMTLESGYYLYVDAEGRYIYPVSSSGNTFEAESTKSHALTITFSNGIASIKNSSYYFYYSTNSTWFSTTSTAGSVNTALYKLDDGQPKDRNLAFSKDEITVSIYGKTEDFVLTNAPVLSGKKLDDVTYSSSNPNVATVNATTGEVTIKRVEGTATITASADPTEGTTPAYLADEASYTITVIDEKIYYKKINSRDDLPGTTETSATGNYLFVYENGDKAFVFKAICDGTPTGRGDENTGHVELTKSGSAIEVDLTADGIEATDVVKDCQLQLAHHTTATRNDWNIKPTRLGTYWIRVYNDGSSLRILAMTTAGYSGTFTFNGSGNNLEIKRSDSSRNAYWNYNATNNCFEATSTASKISIYKLNE